MPMLVERIDDIARQKQRGVLFIVINKKNNLSRTDENKLKNKIIKWLTTNNMKHDYCIPLGVDVGVDSIFPPSPQLMGKSLYIDVPFDETNKQYIKLSGYFEYSDGTVRIP